MNDPLEPGRFFLPGPTEVDPSVLAAQAVPLFGHRSAEASRLVGMIDRGLRPLFGTSRRVMIGTMSATGFMEASVRAGARSKVLCLVNGAFSSRFADIARGCGRDVEVMEVAWGEVIDPARVDERLADGGFDAVTVAHSETSTGALNPVQALAEVVRRHDDVFLLVDSVTGVGGAEMAADEWGLDAVLTGSQKALAMPPGLAFCVVSERLLERAAALPDRGYYLDLVRYSSYAERDQIPTTPALTLLSAAALQVERIAGETVERRWARHGELAARCHDWANTLRADRGLAISVLAREGYRSPTVTAVRLPEGRTGPEMAAAMRRRGYVIGAGYGRMKEETIRIGHMGDHTLAALDRLLEALTEELSHPGGRVNAGPDPRSAYLALIERHGAVRLTLEGASRRLGTIRFFVFFLVLAPWVTSELFAAVPGWFGWLSIPLFGVFSVLVSRHRVLKARLSRVTVAEELAQHGVARIDRRWMDLPAPAPAPESADGRHPWSGDLDVYGRASLRSLLGPVFTPMGQSRLDGWLLEHPDFDQARARQAAVREIAGLTEIREEAAVEGALAQPVKDAALERFLSWCEAPPVVPRPARIAAWVLPPLTLAMGVADLLGWVGGWAWFLPLAAQATLAWKWGAPLHEHFGRASSGVPGLRRYHRLIAVWERCVPESPLLAREVGVLTGPEQAASAALARLDRWLTMADTRFSSLHVVFAVGLLWDLHVAGKLDDWRASAGRRAAGWMESLGTLEALSSLGTLAADHPDWVFPELQPPGASPLLEADGLGHPLLGDTVGVRNDVTLGPPGRVLLITGSNMAGKSTLLRSLGLSVVLAGAGAPVCARGLRLVEGRLFTSMRVQDSIEAGVSFFMAELERLAALLRAAPVVESDEPPLIFLVDEILQGTNSDERRIAGRRLVRHLLRRRAIGAVTTHDLEFHGHPEIEAAAELAHFRESVDTLDGEQALTFDYRLRPGLATTRNALRLAERVGLTDPDAAEAGA